MSTQRSMVAKVTEALVAQGYSPGAAHLEATARVAACLANR